MLNRFLSNSTSRLPVIYVFTKSSINIPNCISSLSTILQDSWFSLPPPASTSTSTSNSGIQTETETRPKALVLMYDISYAHAAEEVKEKLEQWLKESIGGGNVPEVILSRFDVERNFDGHLERIRREREEMEGDDEVERDRETENVKGGCCSSRSSTRLNGEGSCCEDEASESKVKNTGISGDSTSTSNCCNSNKSSMGCNSNRNPTSTSTSTSNPIPNQTASSIPLRTSSRVYSLPPSIDLQSCGIIYLGEESLSLTNLLLTLGPHSLVLSYSPLSKKSRLETGTTNRLLMRRYTLVQKARDASVIALLVGTLGINSYLPLLNSLRKLLTSKRSARKVYTISVGKLNPAKLANFQEIEMFVLIACEENSMVDGKDFFRPIVTPFEMLLALDDSREWTGEYKLELKGLVDGLEEVKKNSDNQDEVSEDSEKQTDSKIAEDQDSSDEEPHFSLITGGLVSRSKFSVSNAQASSIALSSGETPSNAIALRDETDQNSLPMSGANGEVILKSANGREVQVLQTASGRMGARNGGNGIGDREREWKGLEWSNSDWTGEKPALLEEGREGIAADMGEEERTGK